MKQKIQLIEKQVLGQGQLIRISEELDRDYKKVTGISFLDNIGLNCLLASSSIDGKEVFPKNFEVLFLQSNIFVAPDTRFFTLHNQQADGCKLEMEFKDGGTAPHYPYTLKIYLKLED